MVQITRRQVLGVLLASTVLLTAQAPLVGLVVEYSVPNIWEINNIVHGLPGGKGLGSFIWEPTKWEGPALFDGQGDTKPEIDVYPKMVEDYRVP